MPFASIKGRRQRTCQSVTRRAAARVALVTGGNKGIGRVIVAGLARQGFTVYLGARDPGRGTAAATELNGTAMYDSCSLTSPPRPTSMPQQNRSQRISGT
jgi:NAD(P)-dependent dehydrogenase (short-subunit alcohol dehydrogenase family)